MQILNLSECFTTNSAMQSYPIAYFCKQIIGMGGIPISLPSHLMDINSTIITTFALLCDNKLLKH